MCPTWIILWMKWFCSPESINPLMNFYIHTQQCSPRFYHLQHYEHRATEEHSRNVLWIAARWVWHTQWCSKITWLKDPRAVFPMLVFRFFSNGLDGLEWFRTRWCDFDEVFSPHVRWLRGFHMASLRGHQLGVKHLCPWPPIGGSNDSSPKDDGMILYDWWNHMKSHHFFRIHSHMIICRKPRFPAEIAIFHSSTPAFSPKNGASPSC